MPAQWTAHIPQAMQRHGGSIKPEVEAACDEAMSRFLRGLRQTALCCDNIVPTKIT